MSVSERKTIHRRQIVVLSILWCLVLVSALAVIYQVHTSRAKFNELEVLRENRQVLETQWSQYVLEVSAWTSFDRIESIAAAQLMMQVPKAEQTVMVKLGDR